LFIKKNWSLGKTIDRKKDKVFTKELCLRFNSYEFCGRIDNEATELMIT